jgi:hypothetical protein
VRNVHVVWFIVVYTISSFGAEPKSCGSYLSRVNRAVVSLGKGTLKKIGDRIAPPRDPRFINADEYNRLRGKKIGTYFRKGNLTPEATKKFLEDFGKVAFNFDRMHLGKKSKLNKGAEAEDAVVSAVDMLLRNGFAKANEHTTLEGLLLSENFERAKPKDFPAPTVISEVLRYGWGFVKIPGVAGKKAGEILWDYTKWGFRNAITASLIGTVVANFFDPVGNSVTRFTNERLGWLRVKISMGLTNFEDFLTAKKNLDEANDKLAKVNYQYQIKEISHDEAVKLWKQLNETFLQYRKEMYSVMKDDIAAGRSYYRDGNINYPLLFVNNCMTANNEMMNHEQLILGYEEKKREVGLTPEEEARLKYHRDEIPVSKQRLAAVLVAWKVHEIIYPEFSRGSFMKEHPEAIPALKTYESFSKNFRMEDYAVEFEREMRRQLGEIGFVINQLEKEKTP